MSSGFVSPDVDAGGEQAGTTNATRATASMMERMVSLPDGNSAAGRNYRLEPTPTQAPPLSTTAGRTVPFETAARILFRRRRGNRLNGLARELHQSPPKPEDRQVDCHPERTDRRRQ